MKVVFHPEFPKDVRRFRREIDSAVDAIKSSPTSAGHFLNLGSAVVPDLRRRNLKAFPFFVLYGVVGDQLIFGSVIPSRSDPLTWLTRFSPRQS
jgi:hypothetical protein